jgi:hypothetical protein
MGAARSSVWDVIATAVIVLIWFGAASYWWTKNDTLLAVLLVFFGVSAGLFRMWRAKHSAKRQN